MSVDYSKADVFLKVLIGYPMDKNPDKLHSHVGCLRYLALGGGSIRVEHGYLHNGVVVEDPRGWPEERMRAALNERPACGWRWRPTTPHETLLAYAEAPAGTWLTLCSYAGRTGFIGQPSRRYILFKDGYVRNKYLAWLRGKVILSKLSD